MTDSGDTGLPPKIGPKLKTSYPKGIGRHDDIFVMILDMDKVLSEEELEMVDTGSMIPYNHRPKPNEKESPPY